MGDMPEYVRIELPDLARLDAEIDAAEQQARNLRLARQALIDTEAQKIAKLVVGFEFERRKARYRITRIAGDYYGKPVAGGAPIIWVRYYGCQLFKNGKIGREAVVTPPNSE